MENPQVVLSWKAPLRPYKKRAGRVLRFYLAIALLLSLIVLFVGDKMVLIPLWSILFLFYVLTVTPPPTIKNAITDFGIETGGIMMKWGAFSYFYLTSRFGYRVVTLVGHAPYNSHVYLVLPNNKEQKKIINIFIKKLVYRQNPHRGMVDKLADFFLNFAPDDEEGLDEQKESSLAPPLSQKFSPNDAPLRQPLLNKRPVL